MAVILLMFVVITCRGFPVIPTTCLGSPRRVFGGLVAFSG